MDLAGDFLETSYDLPSSSETSESDPNASFELPTS